MEGTLPVSLKFSLTTLQAVEAYRRRFLSPATNLQKAGPNDTIYIIPESAIPGAFMDHESTYLMADFQIFNALATVDYCSFGNEGVWGNITQELSTVNQGTDLERCNEYATAAQCLANWDMSNNDEVRLYFSNKLKVGYQEEFSKNFIKPPMVDGTGNIMFGLNQFGIGFDSDLIRGTQYTNQYTNAADGSIPFSNKGVLTVGNMTVGAMEAVASCVNATSTQVGTGVTNLDNFLGYTSFINSQNVNCQPSWVLPSSKVASMIGGITAMDWPDLYSSKQSEIVDQYIKQYGSINNTEVLANLNNVKCYPIGLMPATDAYGTGQPYGTNSTIYSNSTTAITTASGAMLTAPRNGTPSNPVYRICYRPYSGIFGKMASKMLGTCMLAPQQFQIVIKLADAFTALQLSSDPCRRIVGTIRDYVRNIGQANGANWGATTYTLTNNSATNGNDVYNFSTSVYAPGYGPYLSIPPLSATEANNKTNSLGAFNSTFSSGAICGRQYISGNPDFTHVYNEYKITFGNAFCTAREATATVAAIDFDELITLLVHLNVDTGNWEISSFPETVNGSTTATLDGTSSTIGFTFAIVGGFPSLTVINGSAVYLTNTYQANGGNFLAGNLVNVAFYQPISVQSSNNEITGAVSLPGTLIPHRATPPEYVLAKNPWLYHYLTGTSAVPILYATDIEAFYGCNRKYSQPQCRRILDLTYSGQAISGSIVGSASPSNVGITYQLSNIYLVGDMIQFPNETAANIIEMAAAGQYNVVTSTVFTTVLQVLPTASQNIIIPLKVAGAKKMFIVFQNMETRSQSTGWYYNSNAGFNIFSRFDPGLTNSIANIPTSTVATSPSGFWGKGPAGVTLSGVPGAGIAPAGGQLLGCGLTNPPTYVAPGPGPNMGISASVQLQIGADYWPQQAMTSWAELTTEFAKTIELWTSKIDSSGLDAKIVYNTGQTPVFNIFENNKYVTTHVPYDCLDDQTILCNYDMAPLYSYAPGLAAGNALSTAAGMPQSSSATRNSALNGYNYLCPRGFCSDLLIPPTSKFCLGFNFSTFKASDGISSSMALGNNTITLVLSGAVGLAGTTLGCPNVSNQVEGAIQNSSYRAICVILAESMLRYSAGGQLTWVK